MHSFRFKHEQGSDNLGASLEPKECFELQREDTLGYLSWYLDHMSRRQGVPQLALGTVGQVIKLLAAFTDSELLGQDSIILCTEV